MKKIFLVLLICILSTISICAINSNTISENNINIEKVNTIKLYIPASVKIVDINNDTTFIDIYTNDFYKKYIIYDLHDSVLNIKMKTGTYEDWDITPSDVLIKIGIPNNNEFKITTVKDLIITGEKNINSSNHENN